MLRIVFYDQELMGEISNKSINNIIELRQGLESLIDYFKGEAKAGQGKRPCRGSCLQIATTFPKPLKGYPHPVLPLYPEQEDHPQKVGREERRSLEIEK